MSHYFEGLVFLTECSAKAKQTKRKCNHVAISPKQVLMPSHIWTHKVYIPFRYQAKMRFEYLQSKSTICFKESFFDIMESAAALFAMPSRSTLTYDRRLDHMHALSKSIKNILI